MACLTDLKLHKPLTSENEKARLRKELIQIRRLQFEITIQCHLAAFVRFFGAAYIFHELFLIHFGAESRQVKSRKIPLLGFTGYGPRLMFCAVIIFRLACEVK